MKPNPFNLESKWAIVTGANTGLGQAMAIALAESGANIVLVGRSSCAQTADQVMKIGTQAYEINVDLGNKDSLDDVIDDAFQRTKRLDILVNNAGIIRRNDALDFSETD